MRTREIIAWVVVGIMAMGVFLALYWAWELKVATEAELSHRQYWEAEDFKTLEKKLEVAYSAIQNIKYPTTVPPKEVWHYQDNPLNGHYIRLTDSLALIIDSMGRIAAKIDTQYIIQYPSNPKILKGLFTSDTLRLDMLWPNGNIITSLWETDYEAYRYEWSEGSMTAKRLPPKNLKVPFGKQLGHDLYGSVNYDFLYQRPTIDIDYFASWRKITIRAHTGVSLDVQPNVEGRVGVGYKIF